MSKAQRTLVDFDDADEPADAAESDESEDDSRPDWTPAEKGSHSGADGLECECGRPLTQWTSPAVAREHVRLYGDEQAGTVPGCPGCVEWRDNDSERVESIPHAIQYMETSSSIEPQDRRELAIKELVRDE
jgi:hypothetical protein